MHVVGSCLRGVELDPKVPVIAYFLDQRKGPARTLGVWRDLADVVAVLDTAAMAFPRWIPRSEAEIVQACEEHHWEENHYWDGKSELSSGKTHNIDIAIDIASFALDGGVIAIGLREVGKSGIFEPHPVPTEGLGERIERLALSRISPPVYVTTSVIASQTGVGLGYVFVGIEPSPAAPHRVEDIYRSRGNKTNTAMSDEDVAIYMRRRQLTDAMAHDLLQTELARDPFPHEGRLSHLYMVAQPLTANPDAAGAIHRGGETQQLLGRILGTSQLPGFSERDEIEFPAAGEPGHFERRGQGAAMTVWRLHNKARAMDYVDHSDRATIDGELIDVEFLRSGGIRVFVGGLSPWTRLGVSGSRQSMPSPVIWSGAVVRAVRRLLCWTSRYAEAFGYQGSWVLGIHLNNLRGKPADAESASGGFQPLSQHRYDQHDYERTTQATSAEIGELPWQVAERLVEPLVTTLGTYPTLHHLFTAPEVREGV